MEDANFALSEFGSLRVPVVRRRGIEIDNNKIGKACLKSWLDEC